MFSYTKVICVPPAEFKPVTITGIGIRVSLFYLAPPILPNGAINFKMCILQKEWRTGTMKNITRQHNFYICWKSLKISYN